MTATTASAATGFKAAVILFLKGMAMGTADAVPGVSGGTIAVMTRIYEQLILALKSINPLSLQILHREGLKSFWMHIHGNFLLTLGLGIITALMLMANSVLYLLDEHFELLMAFFIGLVMASTWFLRREVTQWSMVTAACCAAGFALTALIALGNPMGGSSSLFYVFFCGLIAICAMILPGLSGAFILILLGVYETVLDALRSLQMDIILVFAAGCVIGLLSFSHLLSWTFFHYRQQTYAFLTGMLAASLIVLWPWKQVISTRIDSHGAEQAVQTTNVSPARFEALTGQDPQLLAVLFLIALGYSVIALFVRLSSPQVSR